MGSADEKTAAARIPVTVTFLEMTEPHGLPPVPTPNLKLALMRAVEPTVHFYRYLYDVVGRQWKWIDRKRISDDALSAIIHDDKVEFYVVYVEGVPAGYAEIDFREFPKVVDLAYFGLVADFIGRGLGPWLLTWTIAAMWRGGPARITVNTCTLDHPSALPLYQRMGFSPYDRRETWITDDV